MVPRQLELAGARFEGGDDLGGDAAYRSQLLISGSAP
jgi:hypothetical protein